MNNETSFDSRHLYVDKHRVSEAYMRTTGPETKCTVMYHGFFTHVCSLEPCAVDKLFQMVSVYEPDIQWTRSGLVEYIKFTWLRLMEQQRVVWVKGATSYCHQPLGLTQYFLIFHTGLFVRNGSSHDPLFVVATQVKFSRHFHILGSNMIQGCAHPVVQYVQNVLNQPPGRVETRGSLERATFFNPQDRQLLYNTTLPFVYRAKHILSDRHERVLKVLVHHHVCHENLPDQMKNWILESLWYCGRSFFGCAVPQMHYKILDNEYHGRRQLLLPLFCGLNYPILALPVDFVENQQPDAGDEWISGCDIAATLNGKSFVDVQVCGKNGVVGADAPTCYYRAQTALTLEWARMNARLVDVPQAKWLLRSTA
jgi:hypothetical protein